MDGRMSNSRIMLLAVALGFAAGFSWVALTGGPMPAAARVASAD
jgi:hypothetical protein